MSEMGALYVRTSFQYNLRYHVTTNISRPLISDWNQRKTFCTGMHVSKVCYIYISDGAKITKQRTIGKRTSNAKNDPEASSAKVTRVASTLEQVLEDNQQFLAGLVE